MGMAASMTCPTLSPEYAEATVKITQSETPQATDRNVVSGGVSCGMTIGSYCSPWPSVT